MRLSMDPIKTLDLVKNHIAAGDIAEATVGIFSYLHWRIRGGCEPRCKRLFGNLLGGDTLAADLGAQLLESIAKLERDSLKSSEACNCSLCKSVGPKFYHQQLKENKSPISRKERDFLWEDKYQK